MAISNRAVLHKCVPRRAGSALLSVPRASLQLALLTFVMLAGAPLSAQQSNARASERQRETAPPRETDLTLSISKVNGQPGKEVSVPVLFSRKEGSANLTKLRVRLQYPGKALKFVRLEDAYMSRRAKMAIQSSEQANPQAQSSLDLNFDLPTGVEDTGARPEFPSGQLATLFFSIAEDAPEEIVRIPADAWIDGQPILPDSPTAKVEPGLVSVTIEPVYLTCFFFTH